MDEIGTGFGRTGTLSTKKALERLGFGPCHHMEEAARHPPQFRHLAAYVRGEPVDWHQVFAGYRSQADFPGATIWPAVNSANMSRPRWARRPRRSPRRGRPTGSPPWAELHLIARTEEFPGSVVMAYAPRGAFEVDAVWALLQASEFATKA